MDARLGYAKRDTAGRDGGNSRNGRRAKIVLTDVGPVEIDVPRGPGCLVQLGDRGQAAAAAVDWYGGRVDLMQIHNLVAWPAHLRMLEAARDRGLVGLIGATHYSAAAFGDLAELIATGRIETVHVPYNPVQRKVEQTILPLADELGLGVLLMRPLGEGQLVRRQPSPDQLTPLRPFGVTTWGQALIKWSLSDPRVHVSLAATAHPGRLAENAAAGSPPRFGPEGEPTCCGWPPHTDQPGDWSGEPVRD